MIPYKFNPEEAFNVIKEHWETWAESVRCNKWVIGISGGKDSTVVAALAVRIFGKENVLGVMLPNHIQDDINDSIEVCETLEINHITMNIKNVYGAMMQELETNALWKLGINEASSDTVINLPPRLRMAALYAVAQSVGGMVVNTSNRSENVVSFSTLYGDHAGSYAPIQDLTVTEVMALGDWLRLPEYLVHKTPVDGLQSRTDEEKLGISYAEIDDIIRFDKGSDANKELVDSYFARGRFKLDMVRIPGPKFSFPDYYKD